MFVVKAELLSNFVKERSGDISVWARDGKVVDLKWAEGGCIVDVAL